MQLDARVTLLLSPLLTFAAHAFQPAYPTFVARAASFDALTNPHFFLSQSLVETGILQRFRCVALGAAAQIVVVIARPAGEGPAINFQNARRQRLHEAAVVSGKQQRAPPRAEHAFQPLDGRDIEMVGGLIQQQQIRLADQCTTQQYAALHTARQCREFYLRG